MADAAQPEQQAHGRRARSEYDMMRDVADLAARTGVLERGMAELRAELHASHEAQAIRFTAIEQHLLKQDIEVKAWQDQAARQHTEILAALDGGIKGMAITIKEDITRQYAPQSEFIARMQRDEQARIAREELRAQRQDHFFTTVLGISLSVFTLIVASGLNRLTWIPSEVYVAVMVVTGVVIALLTRRAGIAHIRARTGAAPEKGHGP